MRFGEVRLKQGERVLAATVEENEKVDETSERSDTRKVTARCNADD